MQTTNQNTNGAAAQQTIQAVVFDLDGVLMDSEWISFLVWRDLVAGLGGTLDETVFPGMIGLTAEETAVYVREQTGVDLDITAGVAWLWQEVTRRISQDVEPLPGAQELVQTLASRGLPLAIASNSPLSYIENALNGLKMRPFFQEKVGVDMVPQGKPAPDVYLEAARRLGAPPERCLAVEDSLVGMQSALSAGMRVLAVPAEVNRHKNFGAAWAMYPDLCAVGRALEQILA